MVTLRIISSNSQALLLHGFTCTCILSICTWLSLFAQPFTDIVSVSHQYHAPKAYSSMQPDFTSRGLGITTINLLAPIPLKGGNYLLGGGQWSHYLFTFKEAHGFLASESFNVAEFRFGTMLSWPNGKDQTLILALPKWSGQGAVFNSQYAQMGGVVLHTHRVSPEFAYKIGLYYNREFFGNFFMPLIGLDWKIRDDLWLYGNLPGNLQLHKVFSKLFSLSASYQSPNGSLLMENGEHHIRIGRSFPPYCIFSLDTHWTITGPLTLKVSAGHTLWRSYRLYDRDIVLLSEGQNAPYADYRDGFIINISMIVRINDGKK